MSKDIADRKEKSFHFRAFIVLTIFWSLIIDAFSGLVLYTVPPGRVADWAHWTFLGLTKGEWETIHTIFSYVFLISVCIHLYYNWHSIQHYIKGKIRKYSRSRIELFVSLVMVIVILVGTLISIPPFRSVMDLGSLIKDAWPANKDQPFLARAEKLSFNRFVRELGLNSKEAVQFLEKKGIRIDDTNQSLKQTADLNKTSPSRIYQLLKEIIPPEKHIPVPHLLHK
ncbi:MAG: DUF4405 domain-containing protein [Candidatus Aminicenantes bacterium]|nr:DUF4405 domain-containing protein [Candidatus Aminicenantes bacterium]